jgi:hypothetical protein
MRYLRYAARYAAIVGAFALLAGVAARPASAQVRVGIGIGVGAPAYVAPAPVCSYGYYGYAPYRCAPYGYYGPDYFVDGVFIGAGPWYHPREYYYARPSYYSRTYVYRDYDRRWDRDRDDRFRGRDFREDRHDRDDRFRGRDRDDRSRDRDDRGFRGNGHDNGRHNGRR